MLKSEVIQGDTREVLAGMPAASCQACVTSPPYFGLRNYGVNGQLGLEPTLGEYVENMVAVFREVRRVLRDDGTLWLNLGSRIEDGQFWAFGACVAAGLRHDGWLLCQQIIWYKIDANLDSSDRRPRSNHESVFLLAKTDRYYFDFHALMGWQRYAVWPIATANYPEAHFAVFPTDLVEPCIRAGTSERGCCPECEAGWVRVVEKERVATRPGRNNVFDPTGMANRDPGRHVTEVSTIDWQPGCGCYVKAKAGRFWPESKHQPRPVVSPCTVLDPFAGSGTVGVVCAHENRAFIGIELNPEYVKMAEARIGKAMQLADENRRQGVFEWTI